VRRRFFGALPTAPEAQQPLDFILALYRVETLARDAGLVRSNAHRELRQQQSLPVLARLRDWAGGTAPEPPAQGAAGTDYHLRPKQWDALTRFVSDARLPLDNNRSTAALRNAAL
jgi:transposase